MTILPDAIYRFRAIPNKSPMAFFIELKQKFSRFVMETQKILHSQSNLEKEWSWRNQPSCLQTIPQSYSHQDSMVLAQKQKYRSMEQNRKPRDKSTHHLSLTKEARIYNGLKTISLRSGTRKTGQPLVKE